MHKLGMSATNIFMFLYIQYITGSSLRCLLFSFYIRSKYLLKFNFILQRIDKYNITVISLVSFVELKSALKQNEKSKVEACLGQGIMNKVKEKQLRGKNVKKNKSGVIRESIKGQSRENKNNKIYMGPILVEISKSASSSSTIIYRVVTKFVTQIICVSNQTEMFSDTETSFLKRIKYRKTKLNLNRRRF